MQKKTRWWPAILFLGLDVVTVVWLSFYFAENRHYFVMLSILLQVLIIFLLAIWLLFLSRLRWKIRLLSFVGAILLLVVFFMLFPFQTFSGDLIPVFQWRWADQAIPELLTVAASNDALEDLGNEVASAAYAQFLGPDRNAILPRTSIKPDWQQNPPREVWRQPIGTGWSSFAVSGPFAVTQEQRGEQEMVVCYALKTGKAIWAHKDKARFVPGLPGMGIGPRATPTIDSNRVYAFGATGFLNCLDLATGEPLWQRQVLEENQSKPPEWGHSCSPLILGDLVVVSSGGQSGRSLVAYEKTTGEFVWGGGDAAPGYSSPSLHTLVDVEQILIFNLTHVAAHDATNGSVLWQFPWKGETMKVAQPVVLPGDRVFVTSGYGIGGKMLQISKNAEGAFAAELLWESNRMKAKFTNVIHHNGYIYGLDDGILACIDAKEGKRQWKRGRYGHGQIMLVGDLLLVISEQGELALVEANPEEFREVALFAAIQGKTWNNPALAAPYLLVRNGREAACYELAMLD